MRKILWTALFTGALSACGHVTVADTEVCGDLGAAGAHCAHTLTAEIRDIPKAQWDSDRIGELCMNSTAFNDTETALDQLCQTTNLCDFQTQQAVTKALDRIRRVAKIARAAKAKAGH